MDQSHRNVAKSRVVYLDVSHWTRCRTFVSPEQIQSIDTSINLDETIINYIAMSAERAMSALTVHHRRPDATRGSTGVVHGPASRTIFSYFFNNIRTT